jgi:hypothetical protein
LYVLVFLPDCSAPFIVTVITDAAQQQVSALQNFFLRHGLTPARRHSLV